MQASMTERFEMRFDQGTLSEIDAWRTGQPDLPSRAEAIRRLITDGLASSGPKKVKITDGEKLILGMLAEVNKHLKIKSELDPAFIMDAIYGGHYWGLAWKYSGLFHGHVDIAANVSEVVDILDMWSFIEDGHAELSPKDKLRVEKESAPFGKNPRFPGFDGNNETEHMGIARFLIEKLERFSSFETRDLNSHHPSLESYRRMFRVFDPMRRTLIGRMLTADELIAILNEKTYPENRTAKPKSA